MQEAIRLALNDQKLFKHHWADSAQFEASLAALAVPEATSFTSIDRRRTAIRLNVPPAVTFDH